MHNKNFTFGRTSCPTGKEEVRQGVLAHGFRVILCGFLDGTNEVIKRSIPFHTSFDNEDPI